MLYRNLKSSQCDCPKHYTPASDKERDKGKVQFVHTAPPFFILYFQTLQIYPNILHHGGITNYGGVRNLLLNI